MYKLWLRWRGRTCEGDGGRWKCEGDGVRCEGDGGRWECEGDGGRWDV